MIIGAGAVGGALGGRLCQAGLETVLVARGRHLAAMRSGGLRLRTPDADVTVPVTVAAGPAEVPLSPFDVLVVATKTQQVPAVLPEWADLPVTGGGTAGERLPVLLALNGVASEDMALRYFRRVYGICVWMPAVHLVPGEVILRGAPTSGMLHIGRVPAIVEAEARRLLDSVERDWTAASFRIERPADVLPWKYRKLISNIGNAFQALAGLDRGVGALVRLAEAEARAVLDAAGIAYTSDAEEAAARAAGFTMHPVPGVPDEVGGSTWQSLARGTGDLETDFLNGELVAIAHRHGVRAPVNARVAALARRAARAGWPPGSMSVAELAAALGRQPAGGEAPVQAPAEIPTAAERRTGTAGQ